MAETLPVESVQEDFEHLSVLENGFIFCSRFIDEDGKPTQNHHVLLRHRQFMKEGGWLALNMPHVISAQKIRRGGQCFENGTCNEDVKFR